jgi:hypothetical protein
MWWVIGNASNARSAAVRYPAAANRDRSRASAAGSQAMCTIRCGARAARSRTAAFPSPARGGSVTTTSGVGAEPADLALGAAADELDLRQVGERGGRRRRPRTRRTRRPARSPTPPPGRRGPSRAARRRRRGPRRRHRWGRRPSRARRTRGCPAAPGWTCQNVPADSSQVRSAACTVAPEPTRAAPSPTTVTSSSESGRKRRSSTGGSAPAGTSGQSPISHTSWLRWARRPGTPSSSTASRTRVRQPSGPPGSSSTSTAARSAVATTAAPAPRRSSCSRRTVVFRGALGGVVGVLEVAAAAAPGPGPRAGGLDPVRGSLQHGDGVGAAERPARVVGDHRTDQLTGQCVPDEHDPATVPVAGHAVAAVRDGADPQLQHAVGPVGRRVGVHRFSFLVTRGADGVPPPVPTPAPSRRSPGSCSMPG